MCRIVVQVINEELVDGHLAYDARVLEGKPVQPPQCHYGQSYTVGCLRDLGQCPRCVGPYCLWVTMGCFLEDPL